LDKYLVTGGAGCIGSHLCETLLKSGNDVVSLDNFDPFYSRESKERNINEVQVIADISRRSFLNIEGDIRDESLLTALFQNHDFTGVYHLAALAGVRPSLEIPVRYWDVNCTGTATLLEKIKESKIKNLVFASSSSVYGNCDTLPFSEDLFVGNPVSPYAATKRAGELMCYNYSHLYDINTVCIRFFTVYGPRQRPDLAIFKFTKLLNQGEEIPFYGDGTSERDYTYVSDICDGVQRAMEYTRDHKYDIINLGESNAISLTRLIELLEKYTGKKARLHKLPFQPGDVFRTWASIRKAGEKLGYKPKVTKEEGIKKFIDWYNSRYG